MQMYLKGIIFLYLLTTLINGDQWYDASITQNKSDSVDQETNDVLKFMRNDDAKKNDWQSEIRFNKLTLTTKPKTPSEYENLSYYLPTNYNQSVLFPNSDKLRTNYLNIANSSARKQLLARKWSTSGTYEQIRQFSDNKKSKPRFLKVFEFVHFEHVVCTSTSGLEGRCLHEFDCQSAGGAPMGACADGYGTCCVVVFSCYGQTSSGVSWLTSPDFPSPSVDRVACALTVNKSTNDIKQIRLDFEKFELMQPTSGTCDQDQFVVSGQNINHVVPILCGINTGQHIYIEVDDTEGPIRLSIQTVAAEIRLFAIKNNLNYAICIKREKSSCSITYTNGDAMQIVNYDNDGLPLIPPRQAGVEIFNCPSDWLLIAAVRLCGERLNDGSVIQDFYLDAPITDISTGPLVVWFRSDEGYVGRGFKLHYQQNSCAITV